MSEKDYPGLDAWVKAEPRKALWAGKDGMDLLHVIAREAMSFLKPNGFVAVEVGYDQSRMVKKALSGNGFVRVKGFRDFNGYERVIAGLKHG